MIADGLVFQKADDPDVKAERAPGRLGRWLRRIGKRWRPRRPQIMKCAACHYGTTSDNLHMPWFAFRFDHETGTVWRQCPRCGYQWDTGEGPTQGGAS